MIDLRAYQRSLVQGISTALRSGALAPLAQSPTGSGKTVMFAHLAAAVAARGQRVLILVHRRELRAQASAALAGQGIEHGVIALGHPWINRPVQVASVFCLLGRLASLDRLGWRPEWIVIDEAHHAVPDSTWAGVLGHWPRARLLGFTATPARLDGRPLGRSAGGFFDALVLGPSVAELTAAGYLAPAEIHVPGRVVEPEGVAVRDGEFVRAELAAVCNQPQITGDAIAHYTMLANQRPAIAFCASIAHSEVVAEQFRAAGYRWAAVYGGMAGRERRHRLADLATGALHGISTCSLVEEGVDIPVAQVAIFIAHTMSLTRHLQRCGRVMRPHPGKVSALYLDHVGNMRRHGPPSVPRVWSLDDEVQAVEAPGDVDLPLVAGGGERGRRPAPVMVPGRLVAAEIDPDGALVASPRQRAWDLDALRLIEARGGYPVGWAAAVGGHA